MDNDGCALRVAAVVWVDLVMAISKGVLMCVLRKVVVGALRGVLVGVLREAAVDGVFMCCSWVCVLRTSNG